jgi:TonB family protein
MPMRTANDAIARHALALSPEAVVIARSLAVLATALSLAACGGDPEPAAPAAAPASAAEAPPSGASAATLSSATRDYAEKGCSAARRRLERCSACESAEQKPLRDLLLAFCKEREAPSEARTLYEAIITQYPNTEASVTAIMRVRQIDAAELPPLTDYAGAKPMPLERPQPAYPTLAASAGVEGAVQLRFDVAEDGSVENVRVLESTPPLLFDAVALYAVSSWKYAPGHAAESQRVALRFDLSDEDVAAARAEAGGEAAR